MTSTPDLGPAPVFDFNLPLPVIVKEDWEASDSDNLSSKDEVLDKQMPKITVEDVLQHSQTLVMASQKSQQQVVASQRSEQASKAVSVVS